jgi:spermidine synthase
MKPWVDIARAQADGGGSVTLLRREEEFAIRVDGQVLMSSRRHGSEERLAEIGCARLGRAAGRVLVGGLGMGFTLRAALDLLPPGGEVLVAELLPEVVEWNRTVLAQLARNPLADARVRVRVGDVAEVLSSGNAEFDVILIDVDNSPHALTRAGNQALYGAAGMAAARRALRPGGCLAVWSAARVPELEGRMRRAGLSVEVHEVRSDRGQGGSRHAIYAGRAC